MVVILIVGVTTRIVWEAAAIAIVDAIEGTVLAETNAAGVIHNAAVVTFDEAKAIVSGAAKVKHELVVIAGVIMDEVSYADEKM